MIDYNLVKYIHKEVQEGYDVATLKKFLISKGYNPGVVDESINYLYQKSYGGNTPVQGSGSSAQPSSQTIDYQRRKAKFLMFVGVLLISAILITSLIVFIMPDKRTSFDPKFKVNHVKETKTHMMSAQDTETVNPIRERYANTVDGDKPKRQIKTVGIGKRKLSQEGNDSSVDTGTDPEIDLETDPKDDPVETDPKKDDPVDPINPVDPVDGVIDPKSLKDCMVLMDIQKKEDCFLEISWKQNNYGVCDEMTIEKTKDECFKRYALRNEDAQICESVMNRYNKEICQMLIKTANLLRSQGTQYVLNATEARIYYNTQDAMAQLE